MVPVPMIVDADAINALAQAKHPLQKHAAPRLLTPHHREYERLFGSLDTTDPQKLIERVRSEARKAGVSILYKGPPVVIAAASGECCVCNRGTSALATAGSGDVLSGILVALLARGMSPFDAAALGSWIQAEAGREASCNVWVQSVIASDILNHIAKQFLRLGAY